MQRLQIYINVKAIATKFKIHRLRIGFWISRTFKKSPKLQKKSYMASIEVNMKEISVKSDIVEERRQGTSAQS